MNRDGSFDADGRIDSKAEARVADGALPPLD